MTQPRTMFDKIWDAHAVVRRDDGEVLLYVDRHYVIEGSFHAFDRLRREGVPTRRPHQTFGMADHYVPTRDRHLGIPDAEARAVVALFDGNTRGQGITAFGLDDPRQGIVHVVAPEQGLTLPGMTIVCGDSHTSTNGAFGALAFGIGASEAAHVLATQTLWQRKPKNMRITVSGALPFGITAKDVILAIIARIGAGGGTGHVIEYAGPAVAGLSMEQRMTICNMSIEAGARAGMIAPDDTTFAYVEGRPYTPGNGAWQRALDSWRELPSDVDAVFDREVPIDARDIEPMVTWGTSPQDALPIGACVPSPAAVADPARRGAMERALRYMDLRPGTALGELAIDRVFIGSCTNSRIEDLRAAAAVVKARRVQVPAMVSPGSQLVKRQAEAEGLDRVFRDAGFEWRDSGCSMCVGMNGDLLESGERCASTSNRNFEGRQGKGGRTHLMSPPMAAAAAVTGRLTDVRRLGPGE